MGTGAEILPCYFAECVLFTLAVYKWPSNINIRHSQCKTDNWQEKNQLFLYLEINLEKARIFTLQSF